MKNKRSNAARKRLPEPVNPPDEVPSESARVVYTLPPVSIGVVTSRQGREATVKVGSRECTLQIDATVTTGLVDLAIEDGRRVIIDPSTHTLCGVLQTSEALSIDRDGAVKADVQRFEIHAVEYARMQTAHSFLQLDDDRVEVFARETLLRARGTLRALARLIKLN